MNDTTPTAPDERRSHFESLAEFAGAGLIGDEFSTASGQTCTTYVLLDQPSEAGREVVILATRATPSQRPVEFATTGQCARLETDLTLADVDDPVLLGTGHSDVYSVELLRSVHEHGIALWRSTAAVVPLFGGAAPAA